MTRDLSIKQGGGLRQKGKTMKTMNEKNRRSRFGNMIIASWNRKTNDFVYFAFWCSHVPGREGELTPVFTDDPAEAMQFVYADKARSVIAQIRETWPHMKLFDAPAIWTQCDMGRRLLRACFGEIPEE